MAYNPEDLARVRHLLSLGDQILDVTDALNVRVTDLERGGSGTILCNTTNYWAQHTGFVPAKGAIVIYSDHAFVNEKSVPAFKVGDGNAYVVDLPFSNDDLRAALAAHINDSSKHLSAQDRTKLGSSVSATAQQQASGDYTLVLSTD